MARTVKRKPGRPKIPAVGKNQKPHFDESIYEITDQYQPPKNESEIRTMRDLVESANNGNVDIEANVLGYNKKHQEFRRKKLNKAKFLEAIKHGQKAFNRVGFKREFRRHLRESDGFDGGFFGSDDIFSGSSQVGADFIPLLGGPFFKQLYYHDYIKMHNLCFFASNHDPFARAIIDITKNFTLGRGYRIDSKDKYALALWRAFEKVNDVPGMMEKIASDFVTYGEVMLWKLPHHMSKIVQRPTLGQPVPKGIIPRVRLIDPSVIWDIVTWPEDITSILYYVWVAPTQWQTYTGLAKNKKNAPTMKFIFQTIEPDQVLHHKVNSASNEKRGRSDLFPILGYLKRLRDSVNYSMIALQKQAAWGIDTTIEGGQADIDNYIAEQNDLGTVTLSGSEFVHTAKVKREFLSPKAGQSGAFNTFDWCLSMVAAGSGIPINYFGTHLSGGQTRASALVATEPSAKKFEMRQKKYVDILSELWDYVMEWGGIQAECDITLPEIVVQDRSAKLKDLATSQSMGWISKRRAATSAAGEFGYEEEYDYVKEMGDIEKDPTDSSVPSPLTDPGKYDPAGEPRDNPKGDRVDGEERKDAADSKGFA